MNGILSKIGLIAIVLVIIYIIKKIYDYYYKKAILKSKDDLYESNNKVYKAARAFAQGATFDEIRNTLNNCIEFDEDDIEEILSLSFPHRTDEDGGYGAFIKAVNHVTGKDVYEASCC